jgi:hypothetical protein
MENAFWEYWKKRWPHASSDHNKIKGSANYQETRAAFEAGYQAAQLLREADALPVCRCPKDGVPNVYCEVHGAAATGRSLR